MTATDQATAPSPSHSAQLDGELADRFGLTQLNQEVMQFTGCAPSALPGYRKNYVDAVSGRLPAVQDTRTGRWYVNRADLPRIVDLFGLARPASAQRTPATIAA